MPLPQYRNALPPKTVLHEYRIEQVLGAGGFGTTYLARDTHLDKLVAIKEYLPAELAHRAADGSVQALNTAREADYRWGLERFLQEARTLARFSHPHIVRVVRYFEANGTAYMVMDYERGEPLKNALIVNPRLPEAELRRLATALLDGLAAVHAAGFLHRDIKPDNIFIRADGTPLLIDFGAARQAVGGETRNLTAILTPGYAPLEQYSPDGRQGPWTDLYALGGVFYRCVTGAHPPDAVTRMRGDSLRDGLGKAAGAYSPPLLRAIGWALEMDEKKRPQSVEAWRAALLAAAKPPAPAAPAKPRWPLYAALAVLALVIGIGALLFMRRSTHDVAQAKGDALPPALQAKAERFRKEALSQFRHADSNADGYLSPDEVRAKFPGIAKGFARADTDGDGRLSLAEFQHVRQAQFERLLVKPTP